MGVALGQKSKRCVDVVRLMAWGFGGADGRCFIPFLVLLLFL